jgi:hypothetical protein
MIKEDQLPPSYTPYPVLVLCGNKLISVRIPFTISGFVPLLIGAGDTPKVWLNGPTDKLLSWWVPLVRENSALNSRVTIVQTKGSVEVRTGEKTLLACEREADAAYVRELDFRPIGLNIVGNDNELRIGGSVYARNTFSNLNVMIAMSETPVKVSPAEMK